MRHLLAPAFILAIAACSPGTADAGDEAAPAVDGDAVPAASAAGKPRPADCELTVDGKSYIDGICQFWPREDGSFQIAAEDYFAQVDILSPGAAWGSWNADPLSTHAQAPLGDLTRKGACWVNDKARICARNLPEEERKAIEAKQPDGAALFPIAAPAACLTVGGKYKAGAQVMLHGCRLPEDNIFVKREGGSLGISKHPELCLGLEAPGMMKPPVLILDNCYDEAPSWSTEATSAEDAVVKSSDGYCLAIPEFAAPDKPFPYRVEAMKCAEAGEDAVTFIME